MFKNYPVSLNLNIGNHEELKIKIKALREIFNSGVNELFFKSVVSNLHNNQQQLPSTWNKKTLLEWVDFLNPYMENETLHIQQLDKLFGYLTTYHSGIIRKNRDSFDMMLRHLEYDERFLFEYIALNAMEEN